MTGAAVFSNPQIPVEIVAVEFVAEGQFPLFIRWRACLEHQLLQPFQHDGSFCARRVCFRRKGNLVLPFDNVKPGHLFRRVFCKFTDFIFILKICKIVLKVL